MVEEKIPHDNMAGRKNKIAHKKDLPKYFVTLRIGSREQESYGDSISEVLSTFNPKLINIFGSIKVRQDDKKAEIAMRPFQIKMVLRNPIFRRLIESRFLRLLK